MSELIKPEELNITDPDGTERTYILSNFDAVNGREIITQYPMTGLPKAGDYPENKKLMNKLMSYVAVVVDDKKIRLETDALINNHVRNADTLLQIEMAMMVKNCSFFRDGRSLDFFDMLAQMFTKKLLEILTPSSEPSLQEEKQPSMN